MKTTSYILTFLSHAPSFENSSYGIGMGVYGKVLVDRFESKTLQEFMAKNLTRNGKIKPNVMYVLPPNVVEMFLSEDVTQEDWYIREIFQVYNHYDNYRLYVEVFE